MPLEQFLSIVMTGIFAIEGEIYDGFLLTGVLQMRMSHRYFWQPSQIADKKLALTKPKNLPRMGFE
jgi:hypothetical protein